MKHCTGIRMIVYSILLCCTGILPIQLLHAQKISTPTGDELSITFTIIENNYQKSNFPLAVFTLSNHSSKAFPADGWKIYFNTKSILRTEPRNSEIAIKQGTANLFELTPTATFKGIKPGKSFTVNTVIEDQIYNMNDQPEGFYVVYNSNPEKGYNIKEVTITRPPMDPVNGSRASDFAATIYSRNELIIKNTATDLPAVFPTPASYQSTGVSFNIDANTPVLADPLFQKEAALLSAELETLFNRKTTASRERSAMAIRLKTKLGLGPEAYQLIVNSGEISIEASGAAGIFYGIQTLKTLIPPAAWAGKQVSVPVPGVTISDAPRFGYRGFMLDVARNFQTKEQVLRVLNLMALYKLNTFHFHITDDEGWRLEIDGIPELTTAGANRGHTLNDQNHLPPAYGSGADTGLSYGSGHYTRADFIEILKYANDRHIKVITEIETPGHARAAIKAMNFRFRKYMQQGNKEEALRYFLTDTLDKSVYSTPQSFHDNVINVALPSVYTFVDKIVTEVNNLYMEAGVPISTMHFGGDEVPAGAWERSPACNALISSDPSLHNINDLWYYYFSRVDSILKRKNLTLSGWEEIGLRKTILDGKKTMIPNPSYTGKDMKLYVWNNIGSNEDLAYKLANSGYKVVLTCVTNFYLDMVHYKTYDEPGYYWGSITDLDKVYRFIPFDYLKNELLDYRGLPFDSNVLSRKQRLTEYGKENILGLQGAIWSETLKGAKSLEYMLLPRLAALAERAWSKDPAWAKETDTTKAAGLFRKDWSSFVHNVGTIQLPLLDHYNGGYSYRIPPAGAIISNGAVLANLQLPGFTIRYTTNGTEPTVKSPVYSGPITNKGIIRLKVFNNTGRESYVTTVENR